MLRRMLACVAIIFGVVFTIQPVVSVETVAIPAHRPDLAHQILDAMDKKHADVCVIGFNVGTANAFLHINKTKKFIAIVDCGYQSAVHSTKGLLTHAFTEIIRGFLQQGYAISATIVTHWHTDHYNFLLIDEFCNTVADSVLICPQNDRAYTSLKWRGAICNWKNDALCQVHDNFIYSIPVINKMKATDNSSSLVLRIDGVVYTGDIDTGGLNMSDIDGIRGIVMPHHGSATGVETSNGILIGGSRCIRNQLINRLEDTENSSFIFITNSNTTNCAARITPRTARKIRQRKHAGTDPFVYTQADRTAPIMSAATGRTPMKVVTSADYLDADSRVIFTTMDDNALAQCVMFNSASHAAWRFAIKNSTVIDICAIRHHAIDQIRNADLPATDAEDSEPAYELQRKKLKISDSIACTFDINPALY